MRSRFCGTDARIERVIAHITPDHLRRHVETLCGFGPRNDASPDGVVRGLAYIEDLLRGWGYEVEREPIPGSAVQVNLIAARPGAATPAEIIEVGAHYDTVAGSPGADDNASGVGALLEIARLLRQVVCARAIRFCFFGNEEVPKQCGSVEHVTRVDARADAGAHLGIFVFEMIGFSRPEPGSQRTPLRIPLIFSPPLTADFVCVIANLASSGLASRFERAARWYVPDLRVYAVKRLGTFLADAARSDHVSYWRRGKRGVMISDTAHFRNPHYHRPTDTADTLDYEFCARIARATAAAVLDWAVIAQAGEPAAST